jgi:hypothetical protein
MDIRIGSDGGKSCQITITGELSENLRSPQPILFFAKMSGSPKAMRIDGLQFSIQEKMGFNLWWIMKELPTMQLKLIMPLESRGGYDFEKIQSISSPESAVGMALTSFKVTEKSMSFMLMLDLAKQ